MLREDGFPVSGVDKSPRGLAGWGPGSLGVRWGLRPCIPNQLPGEAVAAGPGTTPGRPRLWALSKDTAGILALSIA